ncbi:hypothetical protein [Luteitalea sp.]
MVNAANYGTAIPVGPGGEVAPGRVDDMTRNPPAFDALDVVDGIGLRLGQLETLTNVVTRHNLALSDREMIGNLMIDQIRAVQILTARANQLMPKG